MLHPLPIHLREGLPLQIVAFLISNNDLKDTKVVLLSELPKDLHLSTEFNEKNKRGEYKQIQADLRLDDVRY